MKYKGAMKIDLWRMLVIYKYSGIYIDIDNVPASEFQNGIFCIFRWQRPTVSIRICYGAPAPDCFFHHTKYFEECA